MMAFPRRDARVSTLNDLHRLKIYITFIYTYIYVYIVYRARLNRSSVIHCYFYPSQPHFSILLQYRTHTDTQMGTKYIYFDIHNYNTHIYTVKSILVFVYLYIQTHVICKHITYTIFPPLFFAFSYF